MSKSMELERLRVMCRACLLRRGVLSIFTGPVLDKFIACSATQINIDNRLPDSLCRKCSKHLNNAFEFRKQCLETYQKLQELFGLSGLDSEVKEELDILGEDEIKLQTITNTEGESEYKTDAETLLMGSTVKIEIEAPNENLNKLDIGATESDTYYERAKSKNEKDKKSFTDFNETVEEHELCDDYFNDNVYKLSDNEDSSIGDADLEFVMDTTNNITLSCHCCKQIFTQPEELAVHAKVHKNEAYNCNACNRIIKGNFMEQHMKSHVKHPCEFCGKMFQTDAMRIHIRNVHMKTYSECLICHNILGSSGTLAVHMRSHKNQLFECDICAKKFKSKNGMKHHLRSHAQVRPYACAYCGNKFISSKCKREHERLHSGERPYKCPICNKGFAQRGNMKSHFVHNHRDSDFAEMMMIQKRLKSNQ